MSQNIIQLLGTQIFPAIVGMALVSLRRKPQEPAIPAFASGGFVLFLKVWGLTYVCALLFGYAFTLAGVSEERTSALAYLIFPSICAFYITKMFLQKK